MTFKDLIRIGSVCAIDETVQAVRVAFDDLDDTVSPWLQVACWGASKDDNHWLPDIDEQVCCLFMPTGNADGYVLFSVRDAAHEPQAGKVGRRYIRFADGSSVEHDRETSTMTIVSTGQIKVIGNVNVDGNMTVTGNVIADGVSLKTHTHGGVQSGGSSTAGPN